MRLPYRSVGSFKGALFVGAVAIILSVVLYTDHIVSELRESARQYVTLQVERFHSLFTRGDDAGLDTYLREMVAKDFPLIIANGAHEPTSWSGLPDLEGLPLKEARKKARRYQHDWVRQGNSPVSIEIPEFGLTYYFYYGDSEQIKRLRYLPWIEVVVVGGLILIGYFGFVNIKKSEERSVWVGMARETAHQMGTPLTSLLGWIELLAENPGDENIRVEMQKDIARLNTVAERFNRIGSTPALAPHLLQPIVNDAVSYIQQRLPQLSSGEVAIASDLPSGLQVRVHKDLFVWVIENLLRNAVESLHGKGGKIHIRCHEQAGKTLIDVTDDGTGIQRGDLRNVFRPGYTTKSRGWGLGLSLAKRIIEDIHHAKIFVLDSRANKGTTIRIQLPV